MPKYTVQIVWKELVEHYGEVQVEAANEGEAIEQAEKLNDSSDIEFKRIDGEYYSGPDYSVDVTPEIGFGT